MNDSINKIECVFCVYAIYALGTIARIVVEPTSFRPYSFTRREDAVLFLKAVVSQMEGIDGAMIKECRKDHIVNSFVM